MSDRVAMGRQAKSDTTAAGAVNVMRGDSSFPPGTTRTRKEGDEEEEVEAGEGEKGKSGSDRRSGTVTGEREEGEREEGEERQKKWESERRSGSDRRSGTVTGEREEERTFYQVANLFPTKKNSIQRLYGPLVSFST
ncbi:hypothetical protein Pmani_032278 [Petrolisthes manimaculis]|uniref:Uncharacterized protein n=1 Tax=Petrolisthes manimaculis TaxID=1843537 RepID=A0AAE1TRT6_9EUCA|nr:hypothetical protein Pmani_032278 [Petrolisthes manimaculis]